MIYIIKFDCANSVYPEPFGSFESEEEKRHFLRSGKNADVNGGTANLYDKEGKRE